jgi:TonB family protein
MLRPLSFFLSLMAHVLIFLVINSLLKSNQDYFRVGAKAPSTQIYLQKKARNEQSALPSSSKLASEEKSDKQDEDAAKTKRSGATTSDKNRDKKKLLKKTSLVRKKKGDLGKVTKREFSHKKKDARSTQSQQISGQKNAYLLGLGRYLQRFKVYPRIAKMRGQKGKIKVSFTVNSNGVFKEVKLLQASRYPLLNQAAKTAVQRAKRYKPFPSSWQDASIQVIQPFVFQ